MPAEFSPADRQSRPPVSAPGFTLVELLVVIAIILVLIGIIVPSLSASKYLARQARDLSAGQQLMVAYAAYADDHRGQLLPGYPTNLMMSGGPGGTGDRPTITVLNESGEPITGPSAKRYPWRLAPYLGYTFAGLYKDELLLARYRSRSDFQYVVSLSPSLGLNSTFLGGDAERFGFDSSAAAAWGSFYSTTISQPSNPSRLLVFVSARGVDPDSSGEAAAVPGYFRVDSPYLHSRAWASRFDPAEPPSIFGHVDLRYPGQRGVTASLDGHGQVLGQADLQDMRRWADRATRPDWTLGGG